MMATPQRLEDQDATLHDTRSKVCNFIKTQVVHSLGTPSDLLSVQVRPVGGERYRVNVVVGKDVSASRIPNSYFLTADADGNILTSSPKIDRQY
jgi:hypothetical protein